VYNEGASALAAENVAANQKKLANMTEDEVAATQLKHTINGYVYCNIPGLNMTTGQRVRWYVLSLGNEDSLHTAHWHGISLLADGKHMDQVVVQSSSLLVLDAYADNPGTWLFHCHLTDHIEGGMMALFTVTGPPPVHTLNGKVRRGYTRV
jgi:FtsP/CotA-like multicopper oxidase with cupredoxin domain